MGGKCVPGLRPDGLLCSKSGKTTWRDYRDKWTLRPDSSDPHFPRDLEQVISPNSETKRSGFKDHVLTRPGKG